MKKVVYTLLPITSFALTLVLIVIYFNGIDIVEDELFFPLIIIGILVTAYSIPKVENSKIRKTLLGIFIAIFIILFLVMAIGSFLMHGRI